MIKNKRTQGKIKTHYGLSDYYKYFRTEYPEIKMNKTLYSNIISDFNKAIIDLIIEENLEYDLTHLGSTLSIKKDKRVPSIKNGKLYNTAPVDWVATNKLWSEDIEAKEKKLLVRHNNYHTMKYVFRIYFKKYKYPFINKKLYSFKANRAFSRLLGARIKDETKDRYDTYLLY
jgi:hypothetical protein